MTAICASCMKPIVKGVGRFVLSGTEAFHTHCASGIQRSLSVRQSERIAQLEQDAERTRRDLDAARHQSDRLRIAHEHALNDRLRLQCALENATEDRHRIQRELDRQRADLERVTAERNAARTEAALHQTLAAANVTRTTHGTGTTGDNEKVTPDSRDAAEIRAAMLELD